MSDDIDDHTHAPNIDLHGSTDHHASGNTGAHLHWSGLPAISTTPELAASPIATPELASSPVATDQMAGLPGSASSSTDASTLDVTRYCFVANYYNGEFDSLKFIQTVPH
jgi:hypothetical protein